MAAIICYDYAGRAMSCLYQWDTNMTVEIHNIQKQDDSTIYLHFCNRMSSSAYVVQPTVVHEEGSAAVYYAAQIPNKLLEQPDNIMMYVSEHKELDMNAVIASMRITVIPRIKPDDYIYIPEEEATFLAQGLVIERGQLYLTTSSGDPIGDGVSITGRSVPVRVSVRLTGCFSMYRYEILEIGGE